MYTLRVIEQEEGIESRYNTYLGNNYQVFYKRPLGKSLNGDSKIAPIDYKDGFERMLEIEYEGDNLTEQFKKGIVGFISNGFGGHHAIMDNQVVYIVGLDGKTIERVYGMYNNMYSLI